MIYGRDIADNADLAITHGDGLGCLMTSKLIQCHNELGDHQHSSTLIKRHEQRKPCTPPFQPLKSGMNHPFRPFIVDIPIFTY